MFLDLGSDSSSCSDGPVIESVTSGDPETPVKGSHQEVEVIPEWEPEFRNPIPSELWYSDSEAEWDKLEFLKNRDEVNSHEWIGTRICRRRERRKKIHALTTYARKTGSNKDPFYFNFGYNAPLSNMEHTPFFYKRDPLGVEEFLSFHSVEQAYQFQKALFVAIICQQ